MHAKLRSAVTRLGGTDAMVLQRIVGKELAQGPRVGFEPSEPTTEPSCPLLMHHTLHSYQFSRQFVWQLQQY